ncbi:MAG: CRISPR-associated endonuclease Cas6 [Candidatus Marinimicrobia bacterium]|nr:CRISPR-associated endonuclease Cas6 [Candidatus Neomarinimicrobiota bacterium]MDD5583234.1 CRISPR-associated endonuclease Cas6 [Candidatus Neomarinimicrobiota bacterium]
MVFREIDLIRLQYPQGLFIPSDIPKIRAYLSRKFPDDILLHNHTSNGKFRYVYPEIQFKFINKRLNIVGFGMGAQILQEIFYQVDSVEIGFRLRKLPEKEIQVYRSKIGPAPETYTYCFTTPWMALNQKNYHAIKKLPLKEWKPFLERILWGNLRSLAHGFDVWLEDQDNIHVHGSFFPGHSIFKDYDVLTFTGTFKTNFYIPLGLGIGKQVARGFGTVDIVP